MLNQAKALTTQKRRNKQNDATYMELKHINRWRFNIMINKRPSYRMVRTTVHVPTIRTLTVRGLGQLKRGVGTYVFDVIGRLRLVGVRIYGQGLLTTVYSDGKVLLVPVLLILDLGH